VPAPDIKRLVVEHPDASVSRSQVCRSALRGWSKAPRANPMTCY
jgi:hypothetical protein